MFVIKAFLVRVFYSSAFVWRTETELLFSRVLIVESVEASLTGAVVVWMFDGRHHHKPDRLEPILFLSLSWLGCLGRQRF